MRAGTGVARRVGDGRSDGHGAVAEAGNHARRYAHAPVPRRVQHGGVGLAADGDGHLIARCRAGGGAADDLRLAVFCDVNDIVARHGIDGHRRRGDIYRQIVIHRRRVTRFIVYRCGDGHAAVGESCQIGRRDVQRPAAVCADGCGVVFAVQRYGNRLARFGGGGAGYGQIGLRFGGVQNIVGRQGIDGHGRRGCIHAVLAARRGAVAVNVGDAHLHAGVAVFQTRQIGRWHRGGPFAFGVYRRGVALAAEGDGDGLVFLNVRGRPREHQIRALLSRVNHVIGGDGVNADGNARQIHRHIVADGDRVTGAALARNGHGSRACTQCADVRRRDRRAPGAVRQHGRRIGFAVDGHGQRRARRQPVAGTGDNQVLPVFDAVDHVVTRHGIHAQARQVSVYHDFALARSAIAHAVRDAG